MPSSITADLNPELGTEEDYRAMIDSLHSRKMGHILDIVSNHMSATPAENLWWNDVLENGPCSPYAAYFDIDWRPVKEQLQNKLLLPMLGDQYGQVLESGELKLEYRNGAFFIRYYQMSLPLDPQTYRMVLTHGLDALKKAMPPDSDELRELESILTALEHLPQRTDTDPDRLIERQREKEVIKNRLGSLAERSADIAEFIRHNVRTLTDRPMTRAVSTIWTNCSMRRLIGSRTGRRPRMRSIIGVSSISTNWRPFAWKTPRSFRTVIS